MKNSKALPLISIFLLIIVHPAYAHGNYDKLFYMVLFLFCVLPAALFSVFQYISLKNLKSNSPKKSIKFFLGLWSLLNILCGIAPILFIGMQFTNDKIYYWLPVSLLLLVSTIIVILGVMGIVKLFYTKPS